MIILNVSGNITAEPIFKEINGSKLIAFTIASNERYKTRSGEQKEVVTFIRCAIWDKPELAKILHKGRAISATGALKVNYWTDANDAPRVDINMRVTYLQVFGKGKQNEIIAETHSTETPAITREQEEEVSELPF